MGSLLISGSPLHTLHRVFSYFILFYSIFCRKVRLLYCLLLASRRFSAPSCQVANFSKLPACEHVSLEDWSAQVSWLYVGPLPLPLPLPPFPLTKTQTRSSFSDLLWLLCSFSFTFSILQFVCAMSVSPS